MFSFKLGRFISGAWGQLVDQLAQHRGRTSAMLQELQQNLPSSRGFTLIELLVVILIIGILAAIAIPSFLNQRSKASDASAKELVRTAETTAETIGLDSGGSYALVTPVKLNAVESTLSITPSASSAYIASASGSASGYSVQAKSPTGDTFTITRTVNGTVARTCTAASLTNKGGCPLATTTGVSAAYTW